MAPEKPKTAITVESNILYKQPDYRARREAIWDKLCKIQYDPDKEAEYLASFDDEPADVLACTVVMRDMSVRPPLPLRKGTFVCPTWHCKFYTRDGLPTLDIFIKSRCAAELARNIVNKGDFNSEITTRHIATVTVSFEELLEHTATIFKISQLTLRELETACIAETGALQQLLPELRDLVIEHLL
jgi:hypothetical protein